MTAPARQAPSLRRAAGRERARSRRGRTLDRIPAEPKRHRARPRIDGLHGVEGQDATALPNKLQPADDDLVGMVSVQAVAHVLELADQPSLAREDVVAARRGKQAPEPRRFPAGRILSARSSRQTFAQPKRTGGYPESEARQQKRAPPNEERLPAGSRKTPADRKRRPPRHAIESRSPGPCSRPPHRTEPLEQLL